MNNETFDHITKMKLQDYSAAIPAGLWEKIHVPTITPPIEEFDQFIHQKLFDHTVPVSPVIWGKIKPKEDEDRKVFFLLPRAGMVAASILLLILAGTVSAYLYHQKMSSSAPIENTSFEKNDPNNKKNVYPTIINKDADSNKSEDPSFDANTNKETSVEKPNIEKNTTPTELPNEIASKSFNANKFKLNIINRNSARNTTLLNNDIASANKLSEPPTSNQNEETAYSAFNKMDASLIRFSKNKYYYNSKEKQVSAFNHTSNIKNVVICPSDRKLRNTDWDIEVYASPDYAFKTVSNNNASIAYMDKKDSSESTQISFTAGFRIVKPINDHFSLKIGLQFSQINEHFTYRSENEIKTTTVVTVRNITLGNGNTVTVSDTSVVQQIGFKNNKVKNRYRSFDIPALVSYQFGNDDLRIGINAGVIFNLSSSYQGVILDTTLNAKPIANETNMTYRNNIGMGIYSGISITKRINYNTSIFAEPFIRYNLSDMTTPQSSFNQRFSIGGLSIGLRMNLNNR